MVDLLLEKDLALRRVAACGVEGLGLRLGVQHDLACAEPPRLGACGRKQIASDALAATLGGDRHATEPALAVGEHQQTAGGDHDAVLVDADEVDGVLIVRVDLTLARNALLATEHAYPQLERCFDLGPIAGDPVCDVAQARGSGPSAGPLRAVDSSAPINGVIRSIGSGKMIVEF